MSEAGGARAWVLAFVAAAGVGLGTLVGVGCAIGANTCPFGDAPARPTTDGRALWVANCAVCHGLDGRGGRGPSLVSGAAARLAVAELRAKIARGKPFAGMPAFKRGLTERQIAAVADFVVALRSGRAAAPTLEASP